MEKLVTMLWRGDAHAAPAHREHVVGELSPRLLESGAGIERLEVLTADTSIDLPRPSILFGRGPDLASVVVTWVHCLDDRSAVVDILATAAGTTGAVDQYLVTESVPQRRVDRDWPDGVRTPGMTHFSWFPKPERLTDEEFFHGWHDVHTPKTPELHPLRWEYVRDAVARVLTPGSPPVRALVAERFRTLEDYSDPSRLYGSDAALEDSVVDLPQYADFDTLSSRPLFQTIVRSGPFG